jgi:hypothetical protein
MVTETEGKAFAFTSNPVACKILEAEEFKREHLRTLPRAAIIAIIRDRLRTSPRTLATVRAALSGDKTLYVHKDEELTP